MAPQNPEANITTIFSGLTVVASSLTVRRFTRCVMVQKSSRMVPALSSPDMALTIRATFVGSPNAKLAKKRAASMKIGLPGG